MFWDEEILMLIGRGLVEEIITQQLLVLHHRFDCVEVQEVD